jgi:hypothetical protein
MGSSQEMPEFRLPHNPIKKKITKKLITNLALKDIGFIYSVGLKMIPIT